MNQQTDDDYASFQDMLSLLSTAFPVRESTPVLKPPVPTTPLSSFNFRLVAPGFTEVKG